MSSSQRAVGGPRFTLTGAVLDAPDPRALGAFYSQLLGWSIVVEEDDWVKLQAPDGGPGLAFQLEDRFVRPTWPAAPGDQQMMMHLDIEVDDLDAAGARAVSLGARLADFQPQENVRVHLDPAGHPFCLWVPDRS